MPHGKRHDEDREIEELRRSMRPDPRNVAASVAAVLAISIIGIAVFTAYGLRQAEQKQQRQETKPATARGQDSPFFPSDRRLGASHAVARQTVAIRTGRYPEPDGRFAEGSGFVIDDGLVVTAAHVFGSISGSERGPIFVRCDDAERPGTVKVMDSLRDVAALSAPGCSGRTLPLGAVDTGIDDGLHVAGYIFDATDGSATWYQFDTSVVPGAEPDPYRRDIEPVLARRLVQMQRLGLTPYFAVAGSLLPGNSGSAVFDDQGRVVGMLVAADSRLNRSYCVPSAVIAEVLRSNGVRQP